MRMAGLLIAFALSACGSDPTPTYTLYRNSQLDPGMRIHWATFDAAEKGVPGFDELPYNHGNCEFAAEVLNANLVRVAAEKDAKPDVRFWCEPGPFHQ